MSPVQGAFAIVLFVVVGVSLVAAIAALVSSGASYRQIGRGALSLGEDRPAPPTGGQAAEREAEVRQMLEARNARRAARGQATGDVEAELRDLLRESS